VQVANLRVYFGIAAKKAHHPMGVSLTFGALPRAEVVDGGRHLFSPRLPSVVSSRVDDVRDGCGESRCAKRWKQLTSKY